MAAAAAGDLVDLRVLGGALRRRWLGLLVAVLAGAAAGLIWSLLATPLYDVSVVVAPVEPEMDSAGALAGSMGLASLVGISTAGRVSRKDEAIATLTSRKFLYAFITDLKLIPEIFGRERNGLRSVIGLQAQPPTLADAYDVLVDDVLDIAEERRTGLVTISVRWTDPAMTASWAGELIRRVNAELQTRARERAGREMAFLRSELDGTDTIEVRQAVFRLIEKQLKEMMLANVSDDYALRVVDPPVVPGAEEDISLSLVARIAIGAFAAGLLWLAFVTASELRSAMR